MKSIESDFSSLDKPPLEKLLNGYCETVSVNEALSESSLFIDVRSPKEFRSGSIPGSVSLPLFEDMEKEQIGELYREVNQRTAIEFGYSLASSRLSEFTEKFVPFKDKPLTVYCAHGGMRSASVVRGLALLGVRARRVDGGYKSYRRLVIKELEDFSPSLIVIHGRTGTGKTDLLECLPDTIDLEGLARHRSSLFGALNKKPRSQKDFEAFLRTEIAALPKDKHLFIEGESRKIGDVFIPQSLAEAMRKGVQVELTASMDSRVKRILKEYSVIDEKEILQVDGILQSLRMALGGAKVDRLRRCLKERNFHEGVETLLRDYYDPRYEHGMKKHNYVFSVSSEDLSEASRRLLTFREELEGR